MNELKSHVPLHSSANIYTGHIHTCTVFFFLVFVLLSLRQVTIIRKKRTRRRKKNGNDLYVKFQLSYVRILQFLPFSVIVRRYILALSFFFLRLRLMCFFFFVFIYSKKNKLLAFGRLSRVFFIQHYCSFFFRIIYSPTIYYC